MTENPYPTWIEINLSNVENNTRTVLKNTGVDVMAVVKTNAYGHGAVEIAKAVVRAGVKMLAVVRLSELMELRQEGITAPIMIFGGAMASEVDQAIAQTAVLPVYDAELAKIWSARALALGRKLPVHIKVDSGMGRFGVFPEQTLEFARFINTLEGLEIQGIMSHMAGVGEYGPMTSKTQIARFKGVVETLAAAGIRPRYVHQASSSAILYEPDSYFNMVRAGGVLYGLGDASDPQGHMLPGLNRSFCWKARFVSIRRFPEGWTIGYDSTYTTRKDEIIGVLNVGHGDGYLRTPGGSVLVEEQRCPIVGKICMDQMMVSLPKEYPLGTEAVIIGEQGNAVITPQELARRWSSATTFVTNVNKRIPRIYVRD